MSDWKQTPDALRVERLNAPAREPLTIDELALRAARIMHNGVAPDYYWIRLPITIWCSTICGIAHSTIAITRVI
jgi:hypothetical protein